MNSTSIKCGGIFYIHFFFIRVDRRRRCTETCDRVSTSTKRLIWLFSKGISAEWFSRCKWDMVNVSFLLYRRRFVWKCIIENEAHALRVHEKKDSRHEAVISNELEIIKLSLPNLICPIQGVRRWKVHEPLVILSTLIHHPSAAKWIIHFKSLFEIILRLLYHSFRTVLKNQNNYQRETHRERVTKVKKKWNLQSSWRWLKKTHPEKKKKSIKLYRELVENQTSIKRLWWRESGLNRTPSNLLCIYHIDVSKGAAH